MLLKKINFFKKINFKIKRPKLVIVIGLYNHLLADMVFQTLKKNFKVGFFKENGKIPWVSDEEIIIYQTKTFRHFNFKEVKFLVNNSPLSIFLINFLSPYPLEGTFFASEKFKREEIERLIKELSYTNYLILNYDDETVREIDDFTNLNTLTFGIGKRADFSVAEINLNEGLNFKLIYGGNMIPVWLDYLYAKKHLYCFLASTALASIFNLNLLEVSKKFRRYKAIAGEMRSLEGIKESLILDDTNSADVFSMVEGLKILGKLKSQGRKIAVLGDIVGVGKYSSQAHERIGEEVEANCDLLFTVGLRAKFIAEGAFRKGMKEEKIFSYDRKEELVKKLRKEIKKGDLILIDGSKELKMREIISSLKKTP